MIINNVNASFYIGSSVNLLRRLGEYFDCVNGARKPNTFFERTLPQYNMGDWTVMVLTIVPKHLVLVEEQLAICNFLPNLNRSFKVVFNYWLPGFDLEGAIKLATQYRSLFNEYSANYIRFTHLIDSFKSVLSVKTVEGVDLNTIGNLGQPVFVYDYVTTNILAVYGSVNSAISALGVSQDTIYKSSGSNFVYTRSDGQQLVISLIALTALEVSSYIVEVKPTQVEYRITLIDALGVVVGTYESLREFCAAHSLSVRTFRRNYPDLTLFTEYKGMKVVLEQRSRRLTVYCYDPDTGLRVGSYPSMTAAHKTVKLHYYTFQDIVKANGVHNGVLYSFSHTFPTADN
jgi:hypothetical protein